ncbi:MAG: hypothetical protein U0744_18120 [Gemmataceae bacterium]
MQRSVLRLVAVFCLAGFVLAHGGVALACAALRSAPKSQSISSKVPAKTTCKHCLAKAEQADADCEETSDSKEHSPEHDECPCCPKNEKGCPFPGGCTFCSVAKATCIPALAIDIDAVSFSGERILPASDRCPPGFATSLDRPPRV